MRPAGVPAEKLLTRGCNGNRKYDAAHNVIRYGHGNQWRLHQKKQMQNTGTEAPGVLHLLPEGKGIYKGREMSEKMLQAG